MKALGVLGSLILTALSSSMLQRSSGDTESHPGSAVETYRERYLTPVVLTGIAAFCVLQIYVLIKNVRKQLSKRRKRRARARFQQAVRQVVNINRIRTKRRTRRGPSNLEPTASSTCIPEAAASDPDGTASNVSPEAALSEPCCGASLRSEDVEVPVPSPSSRREQFEGSAEPDIEWLTDIGASASIASIPQIADSSDDTLSIAVPPTAVSARAGLSPQEISDAFVKLGIEWCNPDAGSTEPIASITLTCVADSGDGAIRRAHQPTGPSERILRPVLNYGLNRFARLVIDGGAGTSSAGCTPPGLPDSMSCFSAAEHFDRLGCAIDMRSDQASQHSDIRHRADSREQLTFPPPATASCPDFRAVSSGRATPDSEAVGGLANETQSERGFHSANGSQSEAEIHSAIESPSKSEAGKAGASVESCVKPKATSINLNLKAMSGAAARYSLRKSHRPEEHEALQLEADADTRFRWI